MITELRCRFGHRFETAAKPGGTTGCPECWQDGRRTSVRVSRRARTEAPEAREPVSMPEAIAAVPSGASPWRSSPRRRPPRRDRLDAEGHGLYRWLSIFRRAGSHTETS